MAASFDSGTIQSIDRAWEVDIETVRRDRTSVEPSSRAIEKKYAADPAMKSMLRDQILGTTLRLEPR